jgi:hypothetical protein
MSGGLEKALRFSPYFTWGTDFFKTVFLELIRMISDKKLKIYE